MNELVNKILLAEDKFMPQMYLRHLGFIYIVLVHHSLKQRNDIKV